MKEEQKIKKVSPHYKRRPCRACFSSNNNNKTERRRKNTAQKY